MHNQEPNSEILNQLLTSLQGTPQALILSAYIDERKKWDKNVKLITDMRIENRRFINELYDSRLSLLLDLESLEVAITNESKFANMLYNLFNIKSSDRRKRDKIINHIDKIDEEIIRRESLSNELEKRHNTQLANIPNMDLYEIAMFDNALFKPR